MSVGAINYKLPVTESPYDFIEIFGNHSPVELEIGIGKGRFLIQRAQECPDTNFVGIEWASRYYRLVHDRCSRHELGNVRLLRDDASHTFKHALAEESLSALHVYFPDPWPKKRHNKRRLIQIPFMDLATKALKQGAMLFLATDHVDYFKQMQRVCAEHPHFEVVEQMIGEDAPCGVTNYEVKYRQEGRVIHKLNARVQK